MDLIDRHFAAENAHDVAATLATYTDDVVWDDVGNPACPVRGKSAAAAMYGGIMDAIPDIHLESIGRFACGDHVVDESIVTGRVHGSFLVSDAARVRHPRRPHQSRAGLVRHCRSRSPAAVRPERITARRLGRM